MSLSKKFKNRDGKEESWQKFEMESFESYKSQKQGDKKNFVFLETGSEKKPDFVPLGAWENAGKNQKETEDDLLGKKENIASIEQEAYEKGFVQGEKDGFELGEKKAVKVIENIEKLFNEITNLKYDILKQYEKEILELIFAVAEKIVHHEVKIDETVVKSAIIEALELAVEKSKVIFNVNPDDYGYVEKLRPELFNRNKEIKSIVVSSNPAVTRGGCFLETPYGNIDATIESMLEKISHCLQESVE
jgi:flagellar assembly protein FliH